MRSSTPSPAAVAAALVLSGCLSGDMREPLQPPEVPEWFQPLQGKGIQNTSWTDENGACLWVGVRRVQWGGVESDALCGRYSTPYGPAVFDTCEMPSGERWTFVPDEGMTIGDRVAVVIDGEPIGLVRGCHWLPAVD